MGTFSKIDSDGSTGGGSTDDPVSLPELQRILDGVHIAKEGSNTSDGVEPGTHPRQQVEVPLTLERPITTKNPPEVGGKKRRRKEATEARVQSLEPVPKRPARRTTRQLAAPPARTSKPAVKHRAGTNARTLLSPHSGLGGVPVPMEPSSDTQPHQVQHQLEDAILTGVQAFAGPLDPAPTVSQAPKKVPAKFPGFRKRAATKKR